MKKNKVINNIKLLIVLIISAVLVVTLSACETYSKQGLERFSPCDSDVKITMYMLPDNMLTEYDYVGSDYYYVDAPCYTTKDAETAFLYLVYDEQTYPLAKEYMFIHTDYTENNRQSYNGYEFYDNIARAKKNANLGLDENGNNKIFFRHFNMIGYNDDKQVLIFMGFSFYNSDKTKKLVDEQGWGAFLKKHYSYYNFDE